MVPYGSDKNVALNILVFMEQVGFYVLRWKLMCYVYQLHFAQLFGMNAKTENVTMADLRYCQ